MSNPYSFKIKEILHDCESDLRSIESSMMSHKPLINKWSKKEILGHLIDSAYNNHQRILRAEKSKNFIFDGYDQNEWVTKNNYQNRTVPSIIDLFLSVNFHLAELIESLKDDLLNHETFDHNFDQICMNPVQKNESVTIAYLIEDYIFHLNHHLNQILGE